ncbi:uncharacterized protein LOC110251718 [Exaiptasia diaphana]|uniref:Uncharacterized protein n=1 Tax=Exaiptasia diaphana TaxID=2652724 RepID=A0A913Y4Q9_EXADI|nr:uncharacterized protein LOC110251718 [Exaiptasia diaphana]
MAANYEEPRKENKLYLRRLGSEDDTERGERFWTKNVIEMKFTVEKTWLKDVRFAKTKPNYGMQGLDPVLEELTGNKLELVGPMLDGYIKEIGLSLQTKLSRSRMTGLMSPNVLFMPYAIFKHLMVLVSGYRANVECTRDGKKITLTITNPQTAESVWNPSRFQGENYLKKRHFEKIPSEGRVIQVLSGRSVVVVTDSTPIQMLYSVKQQRITTTFYVQRYDRDGFAKDSSLQKLMNS